MTVDDTPVTRGGICAPMSAAYWDRPATYIIE